MPTAKNCSDKKKNSLLFKIKFGDGNYPLLGLLSLTKYYELAKIIHKIQSDKIFLTNCFSIFYIYFNQECG